MLKRIQESTRGPMRSNLFALGLAGMTAAAVVLASVAPADAQQRRRTVIKQADRAVVAVGPRSRITVYRRSFLDGGTEVMPGERKFTDYVVPPGYSPTSFYMGPNFGYDRRPLNDPFDLPGFGGHIAGF
jgi:hypothetical protein